MTNFDVFTWEGNTSLETVRTREAFLKDYGSMITPTIKGKIEASEPIKINDNSYFITWHTKNLEYSLHFSRRGESGFQFGGLAVGPY